MLSAKRIIFVIIVTLTGLTGELLGEEYNYRKNVTQLELAAQKLKYNMSREQVMAIMGQPWASTEQVNDHHDSTEIWNWKAALPKGLIWQRINGKRKEHPYEVTAFFKGAGLLYVMMENK